ncbi:MAG: hypothetical protein V4677_12800 [Bacteroidota bacterium]
MKTQLLNIKNKGILFLIVSLIISNSSYSQNKLAGLVSSINVGFAIPIVCVLGLALFLVTAFVKQKNH